MQMTLPELIMASTILTWIVLSTTYRVRSNQRIFRKLDEIEKLLKNELNISNNDTNDTTVTWGVYSADKGSKDDD